MEYNPSSTEMTRAIPIPYHIINMVTERPAQIISGIRTEIVHNHRGSLDNIKSNIQQAELKQLEFRAIWDKRIFYRRISNKVDWVYSTQSIYLSRQLEFRKGLITERYIFMYS